MTTLPLIPTSQNGPVGASGGATRCNSYNAAGQLTWEQNERGRLTAHEYDGPAASCWKRSATSPASGSDGSGVP